MKSDISVARCALHFWEEPCISGESGSGAIFFSGCNLKCIYCQNYEISTGGRGKTVSIDRLSEMMTELEKKGANNINLVTATHYVPSVTKAISMARDKGLGIPIVYNTSGYETEENIERLSGFVDVYLPDCKYAFSKSGKELSCAEDYPDISVKAIGKMLEQVGDASFNEKGIMEKGVIVRHLVLPGRTKESMEVLKVLFSQFKNRIAYSIMSQYTPLAGVRERAPFLARRITKREYDKVVGYALELGIENGFTQDMRTASESFIPDFDETGV